jgi:hypothetical protein
LARLIVAASERSQVWVITHSASLVAGLRPAECGPGPAHADEPERELSLGLEGDDGRAEAAGEDEPEAALRAIELERELGATRIRGVSRLEEPPWKWPD